MKRFVLLAAAWLSGCGAAASAAPIRAARVDGGASTINSGAPPGGVLIPKAVNDSSGTRWEPAEPFSAAWRESSEADDSETPREIWINADACPDPLDGAHGLGAYSAFIEHELGGADAGEVAMLRIQPSFSPVRSLSVLRRPNGSYVMRSTRLTTDVWAQMMKGMCTLQGESVSLGDSSQSAALARVATSKVVSERQIDAATARLIADVWSAVAARAQVVEEIGIATGKGDGIIYEIGRGKVGASTHSPRRGSVLGDVVLAVEHLERVANGVSMDAKAELTLARDLMRRSLARTRSHESCLKRRD